MSELFSKTTMRICAIVVTYHPDFFSLRRQFDSITPQVSTIRVIDNSGTSDVSDWVSKETFQHQHVTVHNLYENQGLGAAYNIGIRWAQSHGYSHVLFLDQDSIPENDMVFHLVYAIEQLTKQGQKISAVGPLCIDSRSGELAAFRRFSWFCTKRFFCHANASYIAADFLISSGSLISIDTFSTVGEMHEDFFIDHIDTEWFLRAASFGFQAWGICKAHMNHSLGEDSYRIWFFGWRTIYRHKPFRYYYIVRNSILLWKQKHASAKWISGDIVRIIVLTVSVLLFGPERPAYLKMIIRGCVDGIQGKSGKFR